MKNFIKWLISLFRTMPPTPPVDVPVEVVEPPKPQNVQTEMSRKIYDTAYSLRGEPLTLDPTVPINVRCAQAVSYVLKASGIKNIPPKGISGTWSLNEFLKSSGQFVEVFDPLPGDIIIDITGTSTIPNVRGHVGIVGKYQIMANSSSTGLWLAEYTKESWKKSFEVEKKFITHYYRAI